MVNGVIPAGALEKNIQYEEEKYFLRDVWKYNDASIGDNMLAKFNLELITFEICHFQIPTSNFQR